MRLHRSHNRVVALIALLSLLFSQLALALYVCPSFSGDKEAHQTAPMKMAGDVHSAKGGSHCVEVDQDSPNLCLQYSQAGSQSLDRGTAYVPLVLVALHFAFIFIRPTAHSAAYTRFVPDFLKRDTAPPLSIQHCCFRI